jgi:hypothetical protein
MAQSKNGANELKIKINIDELLIPDLATLSSIAKAQEAGETPDFAEVVEILERVVVGGVKKIPAMQLPAIVTALNDKMGEAMGSVDGGPEGN